MGSDWLKGLASSFKDNLENQKFVDVLFWCHDGQVLGHRLILSFASSFLNELLISAGKDDPSEIVLLVPDFSAYDISDFLMALYGGTLPENTSNFEQILDLFQISPPKRQKIISGQHFEISPDSKIDVSQVFGQICSEIEQEFLPTIAASPPVSRVVDHVPRYYAKRLPANAQLLQVPRDSIPNVPPVVRHPPEQLPLVQVQQNQQVVQTSPRQVAEEEDQSLQQPVSTWPSQTNEPQLIEVVETNVIIQDVNPVDPDASTKMFWTCNLCGERVATQMLLKDHMKAVHVAGDTPSPSFPCFFCPLKLSSKAARRSHELLKHPMDLATLGKETKNPIQKPSATKRKSDQPSDDVTSQEKRSSTDLTVTNTEPEECSDCGEKFASKQKLQLHTRIVHRGERPFGCEKCPAKFASQFLLDEHKILAHSNKQGSEKKPIDRYVKDHNNGAEIQAAEDDGSPASCDRCGKICRNIQNLKFHVKVRHEGEKPKHACPYCSRKFFLRSNLRKHRASNHKEGVKRKKRVVKSRPVPEQESTVNTALG